MAVSDWNEFVAQTDERMAAVRKGIPEVAKASDPWRKPRLLPVRLTQKPRN